MSRLKTNLYGWVDKRHEWNFNWFKLASLGLTSLEAAFDFFQLIVLSCLCRTFTWNKYVKQLRLNIWVLGHILQPIISMQIRSHHWPEAGSINDASLDLYCRILCSSELFPKLKPQNIARPAIFMSNLCHLRLWSSTSIPIFQNYFVFLN